MRGSHHDFVEAFQARERAQPRSASSACDRSPLVRADGARMLGSGCWAKAGCGFECGCSLPEPEAFDGVRSADAAPGSWREGVGSIGEIRKGGVVWRRIAQPDAGSRFASFNGASAEVSAKDAARIVGTVRIDRSGARWMIVAADGYAVANALSAYDDQVAATGEPEPVGLSRAENRIPPSADDDGTERTELETETAVAVTVPKGSDVASDTWLLYDCADTAKKWEVEDRIGGSGYVGPLYVETDPDDNERMVVLVKVFTGSGEGYVGSGVMVSDRLVLTAAHVAEGFDKTGMAYVCTLGNAYPGALCQEVAAVIYPFGEADTASARDYAILELKEAWSEVDPHGSPVGWMPLSRRSDDSLLALSHLRHAGYPGYLPGCVANNAEVGVNFGYSSRGLVTAFGPPRAVEGDVMSFHISSGGGFSGGPFYTRSGSSGRGFVSAITKGHAPAAGRTNMRSLGPKAGAILPWLATVIAAAPEIAVIYRPFPDDPFGPFTEVP